MQTSNGAGVVWAISGGTKAVAGQAAKKWRRVGILFFIMQNAGVPPECTWAAFRSELDIPKALERLQSGSSLTPELLGLTVVALKYRAAGRFEAFTVSQERVPDLLRHQADLMSVLES